MQYEALHILQYYMLSTIPQTTTKLFFLLVSSAKKKVILRKKTFYSHTSHFICRKTVVLLHKRPQIHITRKFILSFLAYINYREKFHIFLGSRDLGIFGAYRSTLRLPRQSPVYLALPIGNPRLISNIDSDIKKDFLRFPAMLAIHWGPGCFPDQIF